MPRQKQLHAIALTSSWGLSLHSLDDAAVRQIHVRASSLGLEHFQEEFVHRHFSLHLDAVEVLHGLGGRLAEEGEGHEQLSCPPRVLLVLGRLIVLQGLVESVLELLNSLHVLYVHGVCQGQREGGRGRVSLDRRLGSFLLSDKQNDTRDSKKYKACEWHGVNFQENAVIYCES